MNRIKIFEDQDILLVRKGILLGIVPFLPTFETTAQINPSRLALFQRHLFKDSLHIMSSLTTIMTFI